MAENQIQQANQLVEIYQRLTDTELAKAASYSDLSGLLAVIEANEWNADKDIEIIINLIKQDDDPSLKLRAIKYLRELVNDGMKNAGLIVEITGKKELPDGSTLSFSNKEIVNKAMIPQKKGQTDGRPRKSVKSRKPDATRFAGLATGGDTTGGSASTTDNNSNDSDNESSTV